MPIRRRLALLLPLTLALAACGGGKDNYESADLYGAYDAIQWGMSLTLVRNIIGAEPASIQAENANTTLYQWETGRGTYLFTVLTIQIDKSDGVIGKIITGPEGNDSQTLGPQE